MLYRSRRADLLDDEDVEHLKELHQHTFAHEAPVPDLTYGAWWLVFPHRESDPVAFCGVVHSNIGPGYGYLKRAGVLCGHWGNGLQRRMIALREAWARREGLCTMLTETTDNPPSANNLIRAGYRMFKPDVPWGLKGALYWRKGLLQH